jgi:hypothetical protein|nr:MAG TPA: Protein of unknown function (DUF551) [Caudoviricetes sp.]
MSDGMTLVQHEDGTFGMYDDTYDVVIHCRTEEEQEKAIDHLKSTNWIPVDEKLPDPDKYILVSFFNSSIPMIGRYTVDDNDGGTFRVGDEDESFGEHGLYVNAWMPLPKCYKED